jgi:predicted DNA-binding protein with PD1-like motif
MKPTGEGNVGLLVLASSPGDEIVSAAAEALKAANATFAWIVARGTLREAMIATGEERVVSGPIEIVSASGTYRVGDQAIDLTAVIVAGGETLGGRFAMAVAEDVELVCFTAAPRVGTIVQPAPVTRAASPPVAPPPVAAPPAAPSPSTPGAIELGPSTLAQETRVPSPAPSDSGAPLAGGTPVASTIPQKLSRKIDVEPTNTIEPEAGDRVTHFAFGDCDVESSDGDRIRLRQDKDERVREVSLGMLRIEAPTVLDNGKRHFRLLRKN